MGSYTNVTIANNGSLNQALNGLIAFCTSLCDPCCAPTLLGLSVPFKAGNLEVLLEIYIAVAVEFKRLSLMPQMN